MIRSLTPDSYKNVLIFFVNPPVPDYYYTVVVGGVSCVYRQHDDLMIRSLTPDSYKNVLIFCVNPPVPDYYTVVGGVS